jgi:GTP-binding protein HflX
VHVGLGSGVEELDVQEFDQLARSAGAEVAASIRATVRQPDPRTLMGRGKVEMLRAAVAEHGCELVLVDHPLTPSQERNLERELSCRVLDRSALILDIFAQRARSFEGQLQVELAQLEHLATRLVRGWSHLERQKGGIGLRGPGETQLETDRRLIARRIRRLHERLDKLSKQRGQGRRARERAAVPTVALVGYTNAGKSTLFTALTNSPVYAADQLFATLDPTVRKIPLRGGEQIVVADTVGFIRALPHELVAAFRATLQEAREAVLLMHVIDAADPQRRQRKEDVARVLVEIGAEEIPQIEVYNKLDLTDEPARVEHDADGDAVRVWLSARTGRGLELLREALAERLHGRQFRGELELGPQHARLRARLYEIGAVRAERVQSSGWVLTLAVDVPVLRRLCEASGLDAPALACSDGHAFLQSRAGTSSAVTRDSEARDEPVKH